MTSQVQKEKDKWEKKFKRAEEKRDKLIEKTIEAIEDGVQEVLGCQMQTLKEL